MRSLVLANAAVATGKLMVDRVSIIFCRENKSHISKGNRKRKQWLVCDIYVTSSRVRFLLPSAKVFLQDDGFTMFLKVSFKVFKKRKSLESYRRVP